MLLVYYFVRTIEDFTTIYTLPVFRYPEKIKRVVAHAGQSYISEKDMEKMMKVIDVSNWSARMREPMEEIYGKVSIFEEQR